MSGLHVQELQNCAFISLCIEVSGGKIWINNSGLPEILNNHICNTVVIFLSAPFRISGQFLHSERPTLTTAVGCLSPTQPSPWVLPSTVCTELPHAPEAGVPPHKVLASCQILVTGLDQSRVFRKNGKDHTFQKKEEVKYGLCEMLQKHALLKSFLHRKTSYLWE